MKTKKEQVIDEFLKFSKIPHGSGNEKGVGEYLMRWGRERNLPCWQDDYGNVIIEKDASEGYEELPRVILQAHMDMVCVAESDKDYDPMKDPIEVYREGNFLKAKGTSLGADDGAGVALILYILSDKSLKHPPVRGIFTVEEETSMRGAASLEPKYLDGKYLINLDWEEGDSISSSCANTVEINFDCETATEKKEIKAYEISALNFTGGHSGCDIKYPRGNAIKILALLLQKLDEETGGIYISRIEGGSVRNAIPSDAKCIIGSDSDKEDILRKVKCFEDEVRREYANEKNMVIKLKDAEEKMFFGYEDGIRFIRFLNCIHSGVFYMSKYTPDFVETSQNVGVVKMGEGKIHTAVLARSSSKFHSEEIKTANFALGRIFGYNCRVMAENPIWEEKGENDLIRIMKKAYGEVTGNELKTEGVHAGLECAFFASVKPDMMMVSAGPQLYDVHTPNERWDISKLDDTVDFIVKTLEMMK